jgi:hypothetical protein
MNYRLSQLLFFLIVLTIVCLAAALFATVFAPSAHAVCGPAGCASVRSLLPLLVQPAAPLPAHRWIKGADGWQQLWKDEGKGWQQIGSYRPDRGYLQLVARHPDEWRSSPCPVALPMPSDLFAKAADVPAQNFGVDTDKLGVDQCKYKINGRPAQRDEVIQLLQKGSLQDDSTKLRLVVIGPEADRKPVVADLTANSELAGATRNMICQAYDPAHWHVAQAGFITTGHPTIYLLKPLANGKGQVLHRQDDYQGGAPALVQAIRKADPAYNAAQDPDKRKTDLLGIDLSKIPVWAWMLGAVAILIYFRSNKS